MSYSNSPINYQKSFRLPQTNNSFSNNSVDSNSFYSKVMAWVCLSLLAAGFGVFFIGPLIPQSMMMGLWAVAFVALLAAGFVRKVLTNPLITGALAIIIPAILGATLYPTINYYMGTGQGNIIGMSVIATAIVFGGMAVLGWTSKKNIDHLAPKLFFILLGIIAVSLLNVFFFHLAGLSFIISLAIVPIFALYTFMDIQHVKNGAGGDIPASYYALNLFLNIYNLFVSFLNIFGYLSND